MNDLLYLDQDPKLDALDLEIIKLLQQDGRMSYSVISRTLDTAEATVRYRIKRLIEENIISISAFVNTEKLNFSSVACIELDVQPVFCQTVLPTILAVQQVSFVAAITGKFNLLIEYVYEDNEDLIRFLSHLKGLPEVNHLDSRIMLRVYKSQYPIRVRS